MTQRGSLTAASRRIYTGRVLNLDLDTVRLPNGELGELEMVRHPGAAAVLPLLSEDTARDPQLLLVRQFRYAAEGPIWEVPAGRLDDGESPEDCARRELLEETGATAEQFERLTTIYTTPGFTDERIHLFAARRLKVEERRQRHERDEFMEPAAVPLSQALRMIETGEVTDAKTIIAILYFAGFRLGL